MSDVDQYFRGNRIGSERWVKAEAFFPNRRGLLEVPLGRSTEEDRICDALDEFVVGNNPSTLEGKILARIAEVFPELADCSLHYVQMDWPRRAWLIGVSHPSLPAVAPGTMPRMFSVEHRDELRGEPS